MHTSNGGSEHPLDPVLDFLSLLWRIEHGLQRASKRMESTVGVTGPQRLVLRIVGQYPDLSAGELAHIIHLHPSTVTGILHRLTSRRLLARQKDVADSRRVRLRLKAPAERLTRASNGTVERAVAEALSRLQPSVVTHAQEVLDALAASLETLNDQEPKRRPRSQKRSTTKRAR